MPGPPTPFTMNGEPGGLAPDHLAVPGLAGCGAEPLGPVPGVGPVPGGYTGNPRNKQKEVDA